jgi:hypothetical protein
MEELTSHAHQLILALVMVVVWPSELASLLKIPNSFNFILLESMDQDV